MKRCVTRRASGFRRTKFGDFVGKKQRSATEAEHAAGLGDVWTFVWFDPDTKLVPAYVVGKRDYPHTHRFVSDLASRMRSRIHLSTDGMSEYAATGEVFQRQGDLVGGR